MPAKSYKFNNILVGETTLKKFIQGDITELPSEFFEGNSEIRPYKFSWNETIQKIILPKSVKTIGAHAFEQSDISSINLENVLTMEDSCFYFANLTGSLFLNNIENIR